MYDYSYLFFSLQSHFESELEMKKKLSEMSLEELWELFPIVLVPHKNIWEQYYQEEKKLLLSYLKDVPLIRLEHIGSTSIPDIYAKDIVDILIEVSDENFAKVIAILKTNNYILMYSENGRAAFNKGYTEEGFASKVYHLHVRHPNDVDELYFRDYLKDNPSIAKDYERLKLSLEPRFRHDRDGYTSAKTDFIKRITARAKATYLHRYN